ncbi:MAG: NifU family protein [Bacteroidia bacterium]|nr:NifU family protein [Bacteroidia bacterium]MDW8335038.1 NifU family protein [Bacteroidia bacterium]
MDLGEKRKLLERVEASLGSIREYLRADGGDVEICDLHPDYTLELRLLGACASCEMSETTMKAGVERAIRAAVPEIERVVTVV